MDHQSTSEEQFLAIKEFLASTWKIIVAVILIGLLCMWGWRYWQTQNNNKIIVASDKYEQLIKKIDKNAPSSIDDLVQFAKSNSTIYSVFANMRAAKFYVETLNDYQGAEKLLVDALSKSKAEQMQSMIQIQIARLQYEQAKYEESLATLAKVTENSWFAMTLDIKGDILSTLQRYDDAIKSYNMALMSSPTPELEKNINIKLNEIKFIIAKQEKMSIAP